MICRHGACVSGVCPNCGVVVDEESCPHHATSRGHCMDCHAPVGEYYAPQPEEPRVHPCPECGNACTCGRDPRCQATLANLEQCGRGRRPGGVVCAICWERGREEAPAPQPEEPPRVVRFAITPSAIEAGEVGWPEPRAPVCPMPWHAVNTVARMPYPCPSCGAEP